MNSLKEFLANSSTRKLYDTDDRTAYYTCVKDTSDKPEYTYHCIRGVYESDLTLSYKPSVIPVNKGMQVIFEQPFFHTLFPRHRLYFRNPFTDGLV
jgi:hypothetical protein